MKNRNGELCKYCVQCDKPCPYGFFNDDICTLTEEQCRKRRFVQNHLEPLMKALCVGIMASKFGNVADLPLCEYDTVKRVMKIKEEEEK